MKEIILYLFILLIGFNGQAPGQLQGQARIDSLLTLLPHLEKDTNKVKLLVDLSFTYKAINPEEGVEMGQHALALATELEWSKGIADANMRIGNNYVIKSDYAKALKYFLTALKIYDDLGDKTSAAKDLSNIGVVYYYQSDFVRALEYYFKALAINNQLQDKTGIARTLSNIALSYADQKNFQLAEEYYFKALKVMEELQDNTGIAATFNNIGDVYFGKKNYREALDFYFKALGMNKHIEDKFLISSGMGAIGKVYLTLAKDSILSPSNRLIAGNRISPLLNAKRYTDSAIVMAREIGNLENSFLFYRQLSEIQEKLRDVDGALESFKQFTIYKDSVFNLEKNKKLTETAMQYEFDKKEAITKAEQEKKYAEEEKIKNRQYFIIAILSLVIVAVLIIALIQFRSNKHKQKANILLLQQKQRVESTLQDLKITQAQLIQSEKMASLGELTAGIAHEIQNPLNFVNNFSDVNKELVEELKNKNEKLKIEDEEVKEILYDLAQNLEKINHHGKRADAIVKGMLQHSRTSTGKKEPTDINALCDEYLRLSFHGLRAKDKSFNSKFEAHLDNSIEKMNVVPQEIGRVILNLINNAFYAVSEKAKLQAASYEPRVIVSTKKVGDKIEIKVEDNGTGIPQKVIDKIFQPFFTTKPTGSGTGLGLSLSYDIIKAHGGEIKVETKEGEGSTFIISLPIL